MILQRLRWASPIGFVCLLILFLLLARNHSTTVRLTEKIDALRDERSALLKYVQRLSASKRVAQVDVLDQKANERLGLVTTLRWQEVGNGGRLGEPMLVETIGDQIYFEAMVIKFDHEHVGGGDPERGTSLALFRRIFGDRQAPSSVPTLSTLPPMHTNEGPSSPEEYLWARFWSLVNDPVMADQYGIRVAQCEAIAAPLQPDETWEVLLDAAGGVNLRKMGPSPAPRLDRSMAQWDNGGSR